MAKLVETHVFALLPNRTGNDKDRNGHHVLGQCSGLLVSLLAIASANAVDGKHPLLGHERILMPSFVESASQSPPIIDGRLDDEVWANAAASGEFWNSAQNRPPTDQTEILTVSDDSYLYFGIRMYDAEPEAIQATRTVRDGNFGYDDRVTLELDTFLNRRSISRFTLNPIGTQSDEIAGGRSQKIEWKGDWLGAATRTTYGWVAEFAVPFDILNYDDAATSFGINFVRYQSRTREESYWADVTPRVLPENMGQLVNLRPSSSKDKDTWMFMAFALAGRNIPDEEGNIESAYYTAGIDARYQPRPDLAVMLSLNPDFTQVEDAITDISFSYSEKSLDENRPFFAEGTDYFSSDDEYFYSNRVPDFDFGVKSFGRIGQSQYGVLATQADNGRYDIVGRTLYEVNETNSAILSVVGTKQPELDNWLTVAQFNGRQLSGFRYSFDAAVSKTRVATDQIVDRSTGSHYLGSVGWRSDHVYLFVTGDHYDADYLPANALLDDALPGTKGAEVTAGYYREYSNSVWRSAQGFIGVTHRETSTGETQREKVYLSGSAEFSNDVRVGLYFEDGPYRPVTDTRGVFEGFVNDDQYSSVTIDFNTRSNRYAGGVRYDTGNLADSDYRYYSAYGWWRPTNSFAVNISAERTDSFGEFDQYVIGGSWDINPEHSLGGRYIVTEDANYYRFVFSRRPRQGLDIVAVYDTTFDAADLMSLKLVKTF